MAFIASAIGAGSLLGPALIGGGAIASGVLGYEGATQASKAQVGAEEQALNLQTQNLQTLKPFINAGTGAVNTLGTLTGANGQAPDFSSFYNSPDYLFAQQQGNSALQNYLNANGISLSGAGITSAINYNQGLATQQYGNYFNRLMQIATLGNNAASTGVSGTNAAANTIGNIGASQASGIIGGTNALSTGINSGVSNSLLYNAINRGGNPSGYGTASSPYPNLADMGLGGGVGTGGYNYIDAQARR